MWPRRRIISIPKTTPGEFASLINKFFFSCPPIWIDNYGCVQVLPLDGVRSRGWSCLRSSLLRWGGLPAPSWSSPTGPWRSSSPNPSKIWWWVLKRRPTKRFCLSACFCSFSLWHKKFCRFYSWKEFVVVIVTSQSATYHNLIGLVMLYYISRGLGGIGQDG